MRYLFRAAVPAIIVAGLMLIPANVSTQTPARKKLLFLTHAGLYKHTSLAPAEKAVAELGVKGGFDVTALEGYKQDSAKIDVSMITPEYLSQFDGLMLMTNGNLPFTDLQKRAIVDFVKSGKALVGAHCATLTMYDYPEFGELLGGYYLRSLVPTNMVGQGKVGLLKVEDQKSPATKMLGSTWPLNEEFYEFGHAVWDPAKPTENISQVGRLHILMPFSRDKVHVLLTLDTEHMDLSDVPNIVKGADYPQSWTKEVGRGRTFYTTLGHRDDIWSNDAVFRAYLTGGIRWALNLEN